MLPTQNSEWPFFVTWLSLGLSVWLIVWLRLSREQSGQLIDELINTLSEPSGGLIGELIGKLGGLSVGLVALILGLTFGPSCGLILGLSVGLNRGGSAVVKHYALRLTLWLNGYTPFNFIKFLDHCARLILLKKVGGGYIFIHRMLLEYFAELTPQATKAEDGRKAKGVREGLG